MHARMVTHRTCKLQPYEVVVTAGTVWCNPQETPKKISVLFFFTSVSIENKKSISFDILEDTLKVYLFVAFLKTQKVFL